MTNLINLKLPQDEVERFESVLMRGGSVLFNVVIDEGKTKYPMIVYMTNDESIINVLKNGIKYIDYYIDEIKPVFVGYLPVLHNILCDGNANCMGIDYMLLSKELLEAMSVSNIIGYLIGLKYLGHTVGDMQMVFDVAYDFYLENREETRNKAKEILEKLKNVNDEDIDRAYDFYTMRKSYETRYLRFFRKIATALNVDGVNFIGTEPYMRGERYTLKVTIPVTLK